MRSLFLSLGMVWLIGCGSTANPAGQDAAATAGVDAALSGRDAAAAGVDAALFGLDASLAGPDASSARDGSVPGGNKTATIRLTRTCDSDAGTCSSQASARFVEYPVWPPNHCVMLTAAGCEVVDCPVGQPDLAPDGGVLSPVERRAGSMTVTGPRLDGGLPLVWSGIDYGRTYDGRLWEDGETLTVAASGDEAPAFSGSVVGPADIVVTAPACAAGACGSFSRSAPLTVTWSGASPATIVLMSTVPMASMVYVTCTLESSPGTIDLPALHGLLEGAADAGANLGIWITPTNTTSFAAGDYAVTISATGVAANGAGQFFFSD